jgi:pimeloyl-ACP methyl ester carboxylesterase
VSGGSSWDHHLCRARPCSHGRSDAPSRGYDLDTLADDVAALLEQRDLRDAVIVAYSMGSIEKVRYLTQHGTRRVRKLVLAAVPDAVPAAAIEAQIAKDFAKLVAENERPFGMPDTIPGTLGPVLGSKTMTLSMRRTDGPSWRTINR